MPDTWPKCSGLETDRERCKVCGLILHCRSCGFGETSPDGLCYACRASIAQAKKEAAPCA